MASRGVEERDEIEKLVRKTNTCTLRDEVSKNTSLAEVEIVGMNIIMHKLMACMINVRREKEAATWEGTTKSVGGTPTGSPRRERDRIRSSMVNKELESLKVAWARYSEKTKLQYRVDRLEKEEKNEKVRMQEKENRLEKEERNRKERMQDRNKKVEQEQLEDKRRAQEKNDREERRLEKDKEKKEKLEQEAKDKTEKLEQEAKAKVEKEERRIERERCLLKIRKRRWSKRLRRIKIS